MYCSLQQHGLSRLQHYVASCSVFPGSPAVAGPTSLLPPLTVHGGEHEGDVGGEEIVHLVPEGSLTEEATPSDQVADGHVEVVGATAPVRDLGEWVCC